MPPRSRLPAVAFPRNNRPALFLPALTLLLLTFQPGGTAAPVPLDDPEKKKESVAPDTEVRCTNGSVFKIKVLEKLLTLRTPYGKLVVPFDKVHAIECATRVPDDVAKRIALAVGELGSDEVKKRDAASEALMRLHQKAYPALLAAKEHKDAEVRRRVTQLLDRLNKAMAEEDLVVRKRDVVETEDSKISGEIEDTSFRVNTDQFGEVRLKLSDIRDLRSLVHQKEEKEEKDAGGKVQPDPGDLFGFQGQVGKTFSFRITGAAPGLALPMGGRAVPVPLGGAVWGTDVYTLDSTLALAAVHAGVIQAGKTGVVKVKILPPRVGFVGSLRNGVGSGNFGGFPGAFEFVKK